MLVYVACMLKTTIFLVYKGVSCEIRVCCAGIVNSNFRIVRFCSNTYAFRLQYLCFHAPIPMILHLETIDKNNIFA